MLQFKSGSGHGPGGGETFWLTGKNEVQNLTGRPVQCWLDVDPGLDEKIEIKCSRINLNVRSII